MTTGIQYQPSGDDGRNRQQGYHWCSRMGFIDHSKGAKHSDIATLKSAAKQNLVDLGQGDYSSKFTIGFEIEKNAFHRGAVTEHSLLAGYERDASCGVEAVTNILPLLPAGEWRNKVFSMMYEAKRIIDDSYSPSDTRCGGHITMACQGLSGMELAARLRPFSGVVHSLYRRRMKNSYCKWGWNMDLAEVPRRHSICNIKSERLEFRLPSRVTSVKQLMRRYELMYVMMDFAVNRPTASFKTFMRAVRPIVSSMYDGNETKVDLVMDLAEEWNKALRTNTLNRKVIDYVDRVTVETGRLDRDLERNGW
tara:strand:+ start:188 stop:1111 length:924 start_codon:yes stop_codon:yes gene_type:complete